MRSRHRRQLTGACRLLFCCVLRCAALRRKLVDGTVVVRAAMHSGAVEVSESIDDHPVVGKAIHLADPQTHEQRSQSTVRRQ